MLVAGDRVNDITFWKEELNNAIRADDDEMENMKVYMRFFNYAVLK